MVSERSHGRGVRAIGASAAGAALLAALLTLFRAEALPPTIDLNAENANITLAGAELDDNLGSSVASGDVNDDGIDDVVIGAKAQISSNSGRVYIFYGSTNWPATIDLGAQNADVTILGDESAPGENHIGWSLAVGDLNGDDVDDVVIGAPATHSDTSEGRVYVLYGSASLPAQIDLTTETVDVTVLGAFAGDDAGHAVAIGDVNDDNAGDLIIGAPDDDSTPEEVGDGTAYVIYGGLALPSTVDLSSTPADITILAADSRDQLGSAVASGDVNGDGADDLVVGAQHANSLPSGAPCDGTAGGRCGAGETYVVYGGTALPAVIDLATASDVRIWGDTVSDFSGSAIAVGDVNGDGPEDIALGIAYGDGLSAGPTADTGEIAVLYGSGSLPGSIDLRTTVDLKIYGRDWWDVLGAALTLSDINGDGFEDIVAGAIGGDGTGSGTGCTFAVGDRCTAGEVFVLHGAASLPDAIDLSITTAIPTIYGDDPDDQVGAAIATGDVNGDGARDLLLGTDTYNQSLSGKAYVIFGKLAYPGDLDGDGCPDLREHGKIAQTGGRRDFENPHDYFNPTGDGQNRVDDILAVVNAYYSDDNDGNPGIPPYAPGYNPDTDRTLVGPLAWNLGPPNGLQRVDDILNIVKQYFHDCV